MLRQCYLDPKWEDELRTMDRGNQSRRNRKRIYYLAWELAVTLLKGIAKDSGFGTIWSQQFPSEEFKRKMLSVESPLTTCRERVMFSENFKLEDVLKFNVCYEFLRSGRDRRLLDGIQFRFDHEGRMKLVMGRRHDGEGSYLLEAGEVLAGVVVFLSDEDEGIVG